MTIYVRPVNYLFLRTILKSSCIFCTVHFTSTGISEDKEKVQINYSWIFKEVSITDIILFLKKSISLTEGLLIQSLCLQLWK